MLDQGKFNKWHTDKDGRLALNILYDQYGKFHNEPELKATNTER